MSQLDETSTRMLRNPFLIPAVDFTNSNSGFFLYKVYKPKSKHMDSGFNHKGIISVVKQGKLQNSSVIDEGPLQKMWQDHLPWGWHLTAAHWAPSASSRKAEIHCVHTHGEMRTAVRNGFDVCAMQKCWIYTETPEAKRKQNYISFLVKHYKECLQNFWVGFSKSYICVHTCLSIHMHYIHTYSLSPAYPSGAGVRVDVYT